MRTLRLGVLWLALIPALALAQGNSSHPLGDPETTTGVLGTQDKPVAGGTEKLERVLRENSGTAFHCLRLTTGSANTPIPVATATPTTGATTPTPTPNGGTDTPWKFCSIRASPDNTATLYVNDDPAVSTTTGIWLLQGELISGSALVDGTCPYSVVSGTGSQSVAVCYARD